MIRYVNTFTAKEGQVGYGQRDLFNIYIADKKTLNTLIDFLLKMVKTLSFGISDELHTRFKQYCIDRDINMKDALVLAVQVIIQNKKHKRK